MVRLLKPLKYFQLFYSDNVFAKIADFTNANGNARSKHNQARLLDFRVAHGAMYFCRPACGEASRCGGGLGYSRMTARNVNEVSH